MELEAKIRFNVAQVVKDYLDTGGTAKELAEKVGVSRDVVYNWLRAKNNIMVKDLAKLCQIVGEDPAWILEVEL